MKKYVLALAIVGASFTAIASGAYDGVYQAVGSTAYVVVQQNGTTLGVAIMENVTNSKTVQWGSAQAGYVTPSQIGIWSVSLGAIAGNAATVSGTTDYGACTSTTRFTFDGAGNVAAAGLTSVQTALGAASGYNCARTATNSGTLTKIF